MRRQAPTAVMIARTIRDLPETIPSCSGTTAHPGSEWMVRSHCRTSVGVHPHQAHQFAADPQRAATAVREQFAASPGARAIGEIGLDYHYDFSPRDVQHAVFRAQLRLARELDQPVVIHTRDADEDTVAILREEGGGTIRGGLHCFTGTPGLADAGLA